jgi:hypothetical protein
MFVISDFVFTSDFGSATLGLLDRRLREVQPDAAGLG